MAPNEMGTKRKRERRPRVAIVRHSMVYHRSISRVAEALVADGYDCDVFYLGRKGDPRSTVLNGVRVIRLPGAKSRGGGLRYLFEYGSFFAITATVLGVRQIRFRYRLVQVYTMPDFLVFAAIVPKLLGARVLAYMQEPSPELAEAIGKGSREMRILAFLEQRVLRFADGAITVTDHLRQRFIERGANGSRIAVVLNCATSDAIAGAVVPTADVTKHEEQHVDQREDEAVVAICHGTVEPRWGHDDILDALAAARFRAPQLRLVLTGEGTAVAAVLARRDRLGLGDIVRWEGWVTEERLGELLKTSDIGIVAQKSSGYSNLVQTTKMYDYWAVGLPVLASRLTATAAAFDDSTILYFRPNDPADLADKLVQLANDRELRAAYAAAGRTADLHVGWQAQRKVYIEAVALVLGDRQLAGANAFAGRGGV